MADLKVPVTITYRQSGTQPPLFVAGTFSNPQWVPQEMDCTTDKEGNQIFVKSLMLPPGTQVQYKIRVGLGDWWVLSDDTPTAIDDVGNRNNLLIAPKPPKEGELMLSHNPKEQASTEADKGSLKPQGIAKLQGLERQRLSSTPIGQVADTAAEVADAAEELDADKDMTQSPGDRPSKPDALESTDDDSRDEFQDHEPPPLFAYECLGTYDPMTAAALSPGNSNDDDDHPGSGRVDYDVDKYDVNDPTLERWPSDRKSVVEAVRKIETCRNEDRTSFSGCPISPVIDSRMLSIDEEVTDFPGHASPESSKRLDIPRKKSQGSMASHRSLASLSSIAEDDEEGKDRAAQKEDKDDDQGLPTVVRVPSPMAKPTPEFPGCPGSDDDEGVVLRRSKSADKKPMFITTGFGAHNPAEVTADLVTDGNNPGEVTGPEGPSVRVQPPDEMDEIEDASEADAAVGPAAGRRDLNPPSLAQAEQNQNQLRHRSVPKDRPATPQSLHSNKDVGGGNWLRAFFRVLFVDWIGGLISRLWGGRRE